MRGALRAEAQRGGAGRRGGAIPPGCPGGAVHQSSGGRAGRGRSQTGGARRRGIYVSNCPGKNSVAVAELAFGLILALDRRIADNVISLREGCWNKQEYSK